MPIVTLFLGAGYNYLTYLLLYSAREGVHVCTLLCIHCLSVTQCTYVHVAMLAGMQ